MAVRRNCFSQLISPITDSASYDSYPYVCVLMISDTEGMIGGETYIRRGDGIPAKVKSSHAAAQVLH